MSVRQSLLAILDQGPCYGYQLRAEFERRTGATWPVNVGQIYNTLERLERDGLVSRDEADDQGHVFWRITADGRAAVAAWLSAPVVRAPGARDELAVKLALAATLPGVDAAEIIRTQRRAADAQLAALRDEGRSDASPDGPEALARSLVTDAMIFAAEAEVRWLDHAEQRLRAHPRHAFELALASERPRRGRPAKVRA
ncbi:PadR family transcriptional regulator [Microbacterium sediminis]|uniref:Transcriptional regulator n=1 Tax=Microbacterium sediminis TaxID=904291 RepID=A0A1B9NBA7_9MICO|nr:PadR family transcriptional regulator [Microbacterium sediminis]OCG73879.1 transcriptional regulator [Microbacterium sediminis]QBR74626.1 PadR family transcriptional regulator [Microbacterium sediminis]